MSLQCEKLHVFIEFSIKRQCFPHNGDFQHGFPSGKLCPITPQGLEFALIPTEDKASIYNLFIQHKQIFFQR